ncbi:MAG: rRNA pseudouridine synthase [Thermoflavifilum aggregans]|nr:rRNA pseudouridine synthase [Thermoflavifilum aggregans]
MARKHLHRSETGRTTGHHQQSRPAGQSDTMPLNKYVAHCGICSRRKAADLIKQGLVQVNGKTILEPGFQVTGNEHITYNKKPIKPVRQKVYVLLNKPKGYLTTTHDPKNRKTVMELVKPAYNGRLFPVGRLDRNTSGLLLLTNDGELAQKLSHPSFEVKKVYEVHIDKPLTEAHFQQMLEGVVLEDGLTKVDALAYLDGTRKVLGLEIHSGKNRIVRRLFAALGYEVEKLDRVMYAGLTKKNLPRGKWRYLSEKEVIWLKHFRGA